MADEEDLIEVKSDFDEEAVRSFFSILHSKHVIDKSYADKLKFACDISQYISIPVTSLLFSISRNSSVLQTLPQLFVMKLVARMLLKLLKC